LAGGTVVVLGAGLIGGPISTTQVLASAIIGAGAGERLSQVHWLVARDMLVTWMITIPATAGLAVGALRLLGWG
jgi:PiT family inorganic phosphate transporter